MKRHITIRLLAVILPLLGTMLPGVSLHAQVREEVISIDSALIRYATICNMCLDLKELAVTGKAVPQDEFQALLQELSTLKTTFQGGSGKMTDAQRNRFIAIRDSYAAGRHYENSEDTVLASSAILPSSEKVDSTSIADITNLQVQSLRSIADVPPKYEKSMNFTLMASLGLWPDQTYGLMGVLDRGHWGAFLRGRSNFQYKHPDYSCNASDGTTSYGHIWTSGNTYRTLTAVTAGGVYNLFDTISLYAGVGYGHMNLFWEDTAGKWALVDDLSGACIAVDTGILLHFGHITAGIGVSSFVLHNTNIEISLGWKL